MGVWKGRRMRDENEDLGAGAGHWYGCDLHGKNPGIHIWTSNAICLQRMQCLLLLSWD